MNTNKLNGKDLYKIGYDKDASRSMAIMTASKHFKHSPKEEVLNQFKLVKENPEDYLADEKLGKLAVTFIEKTDERPFKVYTLNDMPERVKVYGYNHIEEEARKQMDVAMRLPISLKGALMPDAHSGYGLPIGGVLAADNAVIPFGVGVDIGCRMALSIFDLPEKYIHHKAFELKNALKEHTHFGMEGSLDKKQDHEVLERSEFNDTPLLRKLHGKAMRQLGTSGSGNHFVEFGIITLNEFNTQNLPAGSYIALLSHSGSRGLGATVAQHYTKIAMDTCKLPREAQHLAWLDLNSGEGQEYWLSMNLAGDYAKACHDRIHINLTKALGIKPVAKIENHHNFAWRETLNGKEMIIHRKGATPAREGELGIIPGNMTDAGYLVCGKGIIDSLNSASHGAGRAMSRRRAKDSITVSSFKKMVADAGVSLIGGTPEESPLAYKNIDEVMIAQKDLVDIHGKFIPKIVRMNKE
ncbi:RNA-splicing ligase RtcB [Sphingobacteriaceae bacterium]|nr:RNA-splicing ligase RtcB [Sphingobacteriaceae bacterium]